jgi:hypothetical protein
MLLSNTIRLKREFYMSQIKLNHILERIFIKKKKYAFGSV